MASHIVTKARTAGPKTFRTVRTVTWSGLLDTFTNFPCREMTEDERVLSDAYPPTLKYKVQRGDPIMDESAALQSWGGSFWFRAATRDARNPGW